MENFKPIPNEKPYLVIIGFLSMVLIISLVIIIIILLIGPQHCKPVVEKPELKQKRVVSNDKKITVEFEGSFKSYRDGLYYPLSLKKVHHHNSTIYLIFGCGTLDIRGRSYTQLTIDSQTGTISCSLELDELIQGGSHQCKNNYNLGVLNIDHSSINQGPNRY